MKPTSISATLDQLAAETVWLRRLAASLVKDQAAAEDLVHDTVVAAVARPPRDDRPLRPWLVRVLINRVRMHGRGAARRSRREQAVAALAVAPATPDALVDRVEIQRMLAGLVLELSPPLREVVLMHYVEGLSSAAIGRRLGIADGTVRWRLKQAIDELRGRLDQRTPQRAWIAPVAGFAGVPRGTSAGSMGLVAVGAAVLALVAVVVVAWRALPTVEPVRAGALGSRASAPEVVASFVERGEASAPPHTAAPELAVASAGLDVRVTGTVVDRDGRPVDDAELRIHCSFRDEAETGPATARSGRDGTFAFTVDRDCMLSFSAVKGDEVSARERAFPARLRAQLRPGPIVLTLAPVQVVLFKVVDAKTGAPLHGARLSTDGFRGFTPAAVSDAAGIARLRIDDYAELQGYLARGMRTGLELRRIAVDAPGYPSVAEKVLDAAGRLPDDRTPRVVRLVRGIPVSGRVIGPDGRGVAGSYVLIQDDADREARVTDANGAFDVAVPRPGRYRAQASPPGRRARGGVPSVDIEIGPDGRTDLELPLREAERRGELTGLVIDAAGNPVAGAQVRTGERELRPVVTDARGRFAFRVGSLPLLAREGDPVRPVYFLATHGELASAFTPVEIRDRDQNLELTLQLGPAGLAGVVVDLDGAPVPGADVWLNFCCGERRLVEGRRVEADAHGRFAIDVPRGEFVLSVRRSIDDDFDDRDDRVVSGGSRDVRLVLP